MNRRNFLKLGFWGSATLATVGTTATLTGCSENKPANKNLKILRKDDITLLSTLIPVILKGSFPEAKKDQQEAFGKLIPLIDSSVYHSGFDNRKQLLELLDLLNMRGTRFLTTGIWSSWPNASEKTIEGFLNSWKESSIGLLNLGYKGLTLLVIMNWYGLSENNHITGYPGAPKLFS